MDHVIYDIIVGGMLTVRESLALERVCPLPENAFCCGRRLTAPLYPPSCDKCAATLSSVAAKITLWCSSSGWAIAYDLQYHNNNMGLLK